MSSTTKTSNYNLSQFADADKPTWRGDYNGDMAKIDRGMQCNANAAADAHTAARGAQTTADSAVAKASENATTIAQVKTTADSALAKAGENATTIAQVKTTADTALSLAHTNETDIATNDAAFQQYKTGTDTHLSTLDTQVAGKANSVDVYTISQAEARFANHHVGQAAAFKTGTEQAFEIASTTDYKEVRFDAPPVLYPAWCELSTDCKDIALVPGVYQVNFELRLIHVQAGGETYKTSIRCEISDMAGPSPNILGQTDTYFVKETNDSDVFTGKVQGATLSIVESVAALQHIRLRLHAPHMTPAHHITGNVNHAAISFIRLAAANTRARGVGDDVEAENWSSGN